MTTGQRFRLTEAAFATEHDEEVEEEAAPATLDPDGKWVVLVTDDMARQAPYCAVGRLPATREPMALTDRAWQEYQQAAEGAKQSFAGEPPPNLEAERKRLASGASLGDVIGSPKPKLARGQGRWLRPRQWLHEGQVVWLGPGKGRLVNGIALSYLWRTRGQGSSGERLPNGFEACQDPHWLCPSCRIFGSADVRDVSEHGVDSCSILSLRIARLGGHRNPISTHQSSVGL